MRILVAGGTGYLGSALVQALRARGDEVLTLTRSTPRANGQVLWDPTSKAMPDSRVLGKPEIVANLCGAPIARRWTKQYRAKLRESRLGPTELLANWVADRPGTSLINGSAIGIYGHDQPETFTEDSPAASDFLGQLVTDWEAATAPANQAGNRVAFARTGIVLATDSPAGAPLCRLAKAGLGGPMGTRAANLELDLPGRPDFSAAVPDRQPNRRPGKSRCPQPQPAGRSQQAASCRLWPTSSAASPQLRASASA